MKIMKYFVNLYIKIIHLNQKLIVMKRIAFLIVTVIFVAITTTSCIKSRVCECRSTLYPNENENFTIDPKSKSSAKADCENYEFNGRIYTPDYTCSLK